MPDPGREVPLKVGDTTYTLYAGNRALRMMERETGQPFVELIERFERGEVGLITTMVWALLSRHHADLTIDDCDDIIDDVGYEAVTEAVGKAVEYAFPQAKAEATGANSGKARRGTGTRSSPRRSPAG